MAGCNFIFAEFDQAIEFSSKARELGKGSENAMVLRVIYLGLIWSHYEKGDFERALAFKDEATRETEKHFDLGLYVYALTGASWALTWLGRWDEAVEAAQKALEAAERFSDNRLISWAAWSISWVYTNKGDLDRAIRFGELSVEKAPTPADRPIADGFLGWALCRAGLVDKGIELLSFVVEAVRAVGYRVLEYIMAPCLGEGYLLAGEYEKAKETLREDMELATSCKGRWGMGFSHRLLGEVALKTNPEEAAPYFEKAIEIFREIKGENELALAYSGMGRLHKLRAEFNEARRYFTQALEIFERLGTLIEPEKVRKELAELP
jgi:tetratricopeptide (TPR) repeat protein